jgi:hypothetical protein
MASPLDAKLIICDAAQADASTGKVHMLGAGWSIMTGAGPHAVAVLIKVPWDRTNQTLPLYLSLRDADGRVVAVGEQPIENRGSIEVGRPAGIPEGSHINASVALNVPPLPLEPGRYEWRLELAELSAAEPFTVMRHVHR